MKRLLSGGACVALAVLGGALVATPAQAIPGFVKIVANSPTNSNTPKTVTALCPAGKVVIDGGGIVNGVPNGEVHLTQLAPLVDGTGYRVTAEEDGDGFGGNWSVTAIAICATAPAGLSYRTATSPAADVAVTWSVTCPVGTNVLGVGARINGGKGQVVLEQMSPDGALTTVTGRAHEDQDGYAEKWSLTTIAVCVPAPAGLALVPMASAVNSVTPKIVGSACIGGRLLHGAGFMIINGQGQVTPHALDALATTVLNVRADEDQDGYMPNWQLVSFGICAL